MNARWLFAFCFICVFSKTCYSQIWSEKIKLTSSDLESNDNFGKSVSISGNYAVIGAEQESEGETMAAGAAYVFKRNESGEWIELQKLIASDREEFEEFGYSVSISGDYLVVGARKESETALFNAGAAYIFKLNESGDWIEIQKVVASDRAADTGFGSCVSISGEHLAIANQAQAVYFFKRNAEGNWNETDKLISVEASSQFGQSVSLQGENAAIGAPAENGFSGAVYMYQRVDGNWTFNEKISPDAGNEMFGYSLALYNNQLIIGSPFRDVDARADAGGADIFTLNNANSTWEFVQEIHASVVTNGAQAGLVTAITDTYAAIGTYFESRDANGANPIVNAGAAYMFHKEENGSWSAAQKITHNDRKLQDRFASSVAIDANLILVGAFNKGETTVNGIESFGAAYFFQASEEEVPLGISEDELVSALSVYPNPTASSVNIQLSRTLNNVTVTVVDIVGKIVVQQRYSVIKEADVHIPGEKGLYFIQISSGGQSATHKVTKQ